MYKIISATEAQINFDSLLQEITETKQPIIIQKAGKLQVAMIPIAEFERLQKLTRHEEEQALEFLKSMAATIQKRRQNMSTPKPETIIRQARQNRDQLL